MVSRASAIKSTATEADLEGRVSAESAGLAPPVRRSQTFRALRHRNFQLYLGGQIVSLAGTWMQTVALGWLVYQLSRSEEMLGFVGFAAAIPVLIISPWAGVIVDRVNQRKLLIATQSAALVLAFVLSALTFANIVQVWQVIVLAAALGVVNAFDGPARQAFVVEMVGLEDMPNAIALNSMAFNSARVIGPAMGGILLATVGAAWCFFFNGLSFLAVIVSLLIMQVPHRRQHETSKSPWDQLKSGVLYASRQPDLRALLLLALFFSMFGISYSTVLPAFVEVLLGGGAAGFGLLTSAMGVGAVTGAFLVAAYGDRGHRGRWLLVAAFTFPVLLALFAFSRSMPVALALCFLLGVGFMLEFTVINTLLQTRVAGHMRGRVMALYTLTFFGFAPFGNLLVGWLAENSGLTPALVVMAVITMISTVAIFAWTPELRKLP